MCLCLCACVCELFPVVNKIKVRDIAAINIVFPEHSDLETLSHDKSLVNEKRKKKKKPGGEMAAPIHTAPPPPPPPCTCFTAPRVSSCLQPSVRGGAGREGGRRLMTREEAVVVQWRRHLRTRDKRGHGVAVTYMWSARPSGSRVLVSTRVIYIWH